MKPADCGFFYLEQNGIFNKQNMVVALYFFPKRMNRATMQKISGLAGHPASLFFLSKLLKSK
ncbi:hypothetical protein C9994_00930 [Marivirga lumbricoides]|uniref:Uncharacterized protein n=1 Tax=Marivirga lumbricoides TaxID=1046115 RepID=A0A2T4DVI9_9BACT|nr:hypothetical protein C9994_00930 [Marivirga lumbricoides]